MATPQTVIPLEDALRSKFESSTRDELLHYCEELGIGDARPTDDLASLKNRLFAALGLVDRVGSSGPNQKARVFRSSILPEVNLTPSGTWGGRRRRIKVPRPASATKSEKAMPVGWNGKATYWLPFDEPTDVPWPIYMNIKEKRLRRPVQKKIPGADGSVEITTAWEFDEFPFMDLGDSPGTEHLPCSLTEWYQDKGPQFFKDLGERDLITVAGRLDINIIGQDKKRVSNAEITDLVMVFLYGVSGENVEEVVDGAGTDGGDGGAVRLY